MKDTDFNQLFGMLSKIDKSDLNKAISQATQIMNSEKKDEIISELKKRLK